MLSVRTDKAAAAIFYSKAAKHRRQAARRANKPVEHLPILGTLGRCWCGLEFGHDWPGSDEGAPHPR